MLNQVRHFGALFNLTCITLLLAGLVSCKKTETLHPAYEDHSLSNGADLQDVLFTSENTGYVVGGDRYTYAVILSTEDGGLNWSSTTFEQENDYSLYAICGNQQQTFASAFNGKIYKKNRLSNDWEIAQCPYWDWFHGIDFASANKGFMVSGIALVYGRLVMIDTNFQVLRADSLNFEARDIKFVNESTGFLVGYGAVMRTRDGGENWDYLDVEGDFFKSLSCPTENHIWLAGYQGSILHSRDGGENWAAIRNGNNFLLQRKRWNDIDFYNTLTGVLVGDKGQIIITNDGGESWQEIVLPVQSDLFAARFQNTHTLWVAGSNGTLFKISL